MENIEEKTDEEKLIDFYNNAIEILEIKNIKILENSVEKIFKSIPPKELEYILKISDSVPLHHSLGRKIRNNLKLWKNNTKISKWFYNIGIFHGDDRSSIILDALILKINKKEISKEWLIEQIHFYKKYWEDFEKQKNS